MKTFKLLLIFFICFHDSLTVFGQHENNLIPFASGLTSIVGITNAGDERLFVVNQRGFIHIVSSSSVVNPQPFLNISERVVYGGERGLLGLAFHPQYKLNGYFYVNYIGKGDSTQISRFQVSVGDENLADPNTELKILSISQPYSNHNGGDLCFGPDGYLYIGLGDGGSGGDPGNRAQNPQQLLGKMLRIDVDNGNPYAVPTTNPFYNSTTILPEIWAMGLRNPWRFSFDHLTGDLWIADVGQNAFEEVNFQPAGSKGGENYGWKCYEGNQVYNATACNSEISFTFPVFAYSQDTECSVTGGYVYRGSTDSPFYGRYFFTDYCSDRIWTLHRAGDSWIKEDFGRFQGNNFSTFGEDANGQLYVAGLSSGKIFKINDRATSVSDIGKPGEVKITQVPFSTVIRIDAGSDNHHEMLIGIYDVNGVKHFEENFSDNQVEINPGKLAPGVYFLKIAQKGRIQVQKLLLGR